MYKWKTSEYYAWAAIKTRCTNPNSQQFPRYGARGIRVCARWFNSFDDFLADVGPRPSADHSIERIDNGGDYEPANCRWASRKEQARNRRSNVLLTFHGKTQTLAAWAEATGLGKTTLRYRLQKGWGTEKALTTPLIPREQRPLIRYK